MCDVGKEYPEDAGWNVLTSRWLEVMNLDGEAQVYSPLKALDRASEIRCIALASPLDLFAAHRFLLTLLYWKADVAGGVQPVRESLLRGEIPRVVVDRIEAEASCFRMFDDEAPFLQDPSARADKKRKSVGSLFAEFASGTNIAHFHHGDDKKMRLCVRCATIGMLRVVPWSQSGGQSVTPSVHNAPPIMAFASGSNLAVTLGLNLVPLAVDAGEARWTGHFVATDKDAAIPYLEAFTWNPRRIHFLSPKQGETCWGCGRTDLAVVGPIVYALNKQTALRKGNGDKSIPFEWQDPAAFFAPDARHKAIKSLSESEATTGRDAAILLRRERAATSPVVEANANHQGWHLVIPCTSGRAKTYDHRQLELTSLSADAVRSTLPADVASATPQGLDGWVEPRRATSTGGAARFVRAAARLLAHSDWAALSAAAHKEMHDSAAAFDVLSGLLWGLRGKVDGLPSRNVAWLVLKLMATVPPRARVLYVNAVFCPLRSLPKRQLGERRKDRSLASPYPVSFPRGCRLEADLRSALESNRRQRRPERIDWASLCHGLDQLLD